MTFKYHSRFASYMWSENATRQKPQAGRAIRLRNFVTLHSITDTSGYMSLALCFLDEFIWLVSIILYFQNISWDSIQARLILGPSWIKTKCILYSSIPKDFIIMCVASKCVRLWSTIFVRHDQTMSVHIVPFDEVTNLYFISLHLISSIRMFWKWCSLQHLCTSIAPFV